MRRLYLNQSDIEEEDRWIEQSIIDTRECKRQARETGRTALEAYLEKNGLPPNQEHYERASLFIHISISK